MFKDILVTDPNGSPREWTTHKNAACYFARGKVIWSHGDIIKTFRGGLDLNGEQSIIEIKPILGVTGPLVGAKWMEHTSMYVERKILYARDRYLCAYCGQHFKPHRLTIDHVHPRSRGGKNIWMNAVTACYPCNHMKAAKTPEEAHMPLLYLPYIPCRAEKFIMKNRRILADQMDFLLPSVPTHSRLLVNGEISWAESDGDDD